MFYKVHHIKVSPPDLREPRGSWPLECRSDGTTSSWLYGELHQSPHYKTKAREWSFSLYLTLAFLGWPHPGVHHREAVPQLPTGRPILVRERRLAFLIHSWAGLNLYSYLWKSAFLPKCTAYINLKVVLGKKILKASVSWVFNFPVPEWTWLTHRPFPSSWMKSGGWSFPVWSATTLTRLRTSRCDCLMIDCFLDWWKRHPGVRHGPSRPRDQPKGSMQLQPSAKDWSDQVKYILWNERYSWILIIRWGSVPESGITRNILSDWSFQVERCLVSQLGFPSSSFCWEIDKTLFYRHLL